ncbi:MAG: HD domain-containing protein [Candidatus Paceibacterota bacterium]|jgi:putative hydrolase of HD superfamily
MKKLEKKELESVTNFLFETGMLAKTPRSGFFFLGSGEQSVAEHINRVCYIGMSLANMAENVDSAKILNMCLLHDLAEARVSDLNYVHQKYNKRDEKGAVKDLTSQIFFGSKIKEAIEEYEDRKTVESKIAKDADNLEFIMSLKEQVDIGNKRALSWIKSAVKRLKTDEAKTLAESILITDSDKWWFEDKEDQWWVNRIKK